VSVTNEAELHELRELIATLEFVFAKTLVHIPHWYVARKPENAERFFALREASKRHGVWGEFQGYRWRYLYPGDGHKYWVSERGWVINRTPLDGDADGRDAPHADRQ
jgi:hypothetical protein